VKKRRIEWQGRTVEITSAPGRYFCTFEFFETDTSGMGIWTLPTEDQKAQIALHAGPRLSTAQVWKRTWQYYYERYE
jgi:hypothetical protein